ncbi:hypothetical protein QYF61_021598 [Mycteria americana]|uniref:Uncharacterized protein n=1 Tax=Mycteria americana TaxID=33587 RepID=A0AAN7RR36_MYCAM|nr:hypothetical protein QYF61_021598 [Mycteria americana]
MQETPREAVEFPSLKIFKSHLDMQRRPTVSLHDGLGLEHRPCEERRSEKGTYCVMAKIPTLQPMEEPMPEQMDTPKGAVAHGEPTPEQRKRQRNYHKKYITGQDDGTSGKAYLRK